MKNSLILLISILLLSSPLFGQSSKYGSVSQCVLRTMKENKLTGNDMFVMVKEECERILENLENSKKKKQKGVLFSRKVKGEWGWFVNKGKKNYSKWNGEIKNGLPNGKGTEIMSDGTKYVGYYYNGERSGKGKITYSDGIIYEGQWRKFEYNGRGTYTFPNGEKYIGEWKDGEKHGQGTYTFPNGEKYVGEYKNGEKDGQGTLTRPDGAKYVGEYKKGKANGQGIFIFGKGKSEGQKYVGAFKTDLMHGKGTTTALDGTKYTGIYKNGRLWNGTVFQKNGEKIYQRINGEIKIIISN